MSIETTIKTDLGWLKTHAILLFIVVSLLFVGTYGIFTMMATHDATVATQYATIADQQAKQNAQFQQVIVQQIAALTAQNAALAQQYGELAKSLAVRQTIEVKIPQQNANLSAQEVAVKLGGGVEGSNVVLDLPTAKNVLNMVQLVPLLQQDKIDLTKQVEAQTTIAANNLQMYSNEKASHASDNTTNTAIITARDKEIVSIKADARKAKIKWFFIGVVTGYCLRVAYP